MPWLILWWWSLWLPERKPAIRLVCRDGDRVAN